MKFMILLLGLSLTIMLLYAIFDFFADSVGADVIVAIAVIHFLLQVVVFAWKKIAKELFN